MSHGPARAGLLLIGVALSLGTSVLHAETPPPFWPGTSYDSRIPTFRQVLGYDPGERITNHAGIMRYFEALAATTPRMKVFEYGESWEGRKLVYAALGSEANIRKLSALQATVEEFADPRKTSPAEARKLIASLPAIVWLSAGVHGDEVSAPEAALVLAYHLLAARNDKLVESIFANTLVLIDPLQNPDGRDRFVNYYEEARGPEPDANPLAAEHNQPWPGGRFNHYLFDLNRDWIALTQPEIRAELKVLRQWLPVVCVDLHEMEGDSTYFFSPEAEPYNPNLTSAQRENLNLFGQNNARRFDQFGFDYFTRERYDAFYPGYGASWPSYYGAVAMTYEQASARGLAVRRSDETVLSFRETVRHHFVASLATLETVAQNREKLLEDFYQYRASAVEEGKREPVREFILPRDRDGSATDKLAGILTEHGVEVQRATAPFRTGSREYAAGTYIVPLAQPAKRLIRTLLDSQTSMDDGFLAADEARRRLQQRSEISDVTAWSLPLLFNVEALPSPEISAGPFEKLAVQARAGELHGSAATVAYLVPWGSEAAGRFLAAALGSDLKMFSSDRAFTQDGRRYTAGTLVLKVKDNPPELGEILARLARETGVDIFGTNSGWVEDGVNFGSRAVRPVRKPAVAIAWGAPANPSAAGAARFLLERQYGFPVTPVRTAQLARADLSKFQVLILPPGGDYAQLLGEAGVDRLKDWVDRGGTLIGIGESLRFLSDAKVNLLDIAEENTAAAEEKKAEKAGRVAASEIASDADYQAALRPSSGLTASVPGAIVRARTEPGYWLTAGVAETVNAMVVGRSVYTPIKNDKGINAAYFMPADTLLASGYLWEDNRRQMAYKPLAIAERSGRGMVVGFTADPNFRGMVDGLNVMFLNAVFRGPEHTQAAGAE